MIVESMPVGFLQCNCTIVGCPKRRSGDTLFAGGIGRTVFPGGDSRQIMTSIHDRLLSLDERTRVIPGHGPDTTIGEERRHNPFLVG